MKHKTFHSRTYFMFGMIILSALWIISCNQEQYPLNPTGSKTLGQSDAEFSSWSAPVNLGPVINSPSTEQAPFLSKDGLSLFFRSNRPGGLGGFDIYVSERVDENSPWGVPRNLGANINSSVEDGGPYLSQDEHWLYFSSFRSGGCGGSDLYRAHRHDAHDNLGWEPAENLGCVVNTTFDDQSPSIWEDDANGITTLYFVSNLPGTLGPLDIYASILQPDGTFGPPISVPELNSPAQDGRPTVRRRDGLEVIVPSNRTGGVGTFDLWVSTRPTTLSPWSTPVNLGPVVNTAGFNTAFQSLSFDGLTLLITSNRPGGSGLGDIWMSTRTKLHGNGN